MDTIIAEVDDDDEAIARDANATGPVKLAWPEPLRPEAFDEPPGRGEDLDTIVSRVRDDDVALLVDGHTVGPDERSGIRSLQ